jgi:hypothetical protein
MAELLGAVASWPSLVFVVIVFGFAPGFCLRLIVLAYPRSDPRRTELIAELYAVPRIQRPLWVAEQLEVALFEGLARRVPGLLRRLSSRGRTGRQTVGRYLVSLLTTMAPSLGVMSPFAMLYAFSIGLETVGLAFAMVGGVSCLAFCLAYFVLSIRRREGEKGTSARSLDRDPS